MRASLEHRSGGARRKVRATSLISALVVSLGGIAAGVQGASASNAASKAPIVVGAISSISGGSVFGESDQGAQAYFNYVNAHGGIDGRKITFTALDDGISPATAGQDARKLVAQGAVALVAGESLLQCGINAAYYAHEGIIDAPQGIDTGCFTGPNEAPINYSPFYALTVDLLWAKNVLHDSRLCTLLPGTPGLPPGYQAAVSKFEKDTHTKLALYDDSLTPTTSDYVPYAIKVKDARCQFVYIAAQQAPSVAFINDLSAQGVSGVNVLFPAPDYTSAFVKAIPQTKPGVLVDDAYVPYTDTANPEVKRFISIEQHYGGLVGQGSEGGYAAANLFVQIARSIKGPITRASIAAAYKRATNLSVPLIATKWSFGHNSKTPSYADHFLRDENGKWVPITSAQGYVVPGNKVS